jgi:hypothetical protein
LQCSGGFGRPGLPPPSRHGFNRVPHRFSGPKEHRQLLRIALLCGEPPHDHIVLQQEQTPILEAATALECLPQECYRTGGIALLTGGHAQKDQGDGGTGLIADLPVCGQRLLSQVFHLLVRPLVERDPSQLGVDGGNASAIPQLLPQC